MGSDSHEDGGWKRRSSSWKIVAGGLAMTLIVLILLFRPLAISYHRWGLQVANERIDERAEGVNPTAAYNSVFFHCEELERLDYAFHKDFAFDRIGRTAEAEDVLYRELNRFRATLPDEPLHLSCMSNRNGKTWFRVCDRTERNALWVEFHRQHNVPNLAERFGSGERP